MFSPHGQNWGFPVYDWESLGRQGYQWWKDRLRQAGKFFHAFRIDHVLGFFRIWRIPRGELTGLLGRFSPSTGLSRADLAALGFDAGRLRWLSLPHASGAEVASALGGNAAHAARAWLERVGSEDLYNLAPELDSESALQALNEPQAVKDFLLSLHANRTLLADGPDMFYPAWYLETRKGFQSLTGDEKQKLTNLVGLRGSSPRRGGSGRGANCCRRSRARPTCWCAPKTWATCRAACPACSRAWASSV